MKFFTTLILSILLFPVLTFSQQTILKGTVTEAGTGQTLPGVNVVVNKTTGTATDADGKYVLPLDKGTYSVAFRFVGFNEETRIVSLREGETQELDVVLSTESRVLDAVVVSAGKFEQKLSDVTVSMEVIKADFIRNANVSSLEEGLQKIPGLNIMDKQPSIRGGSGYSYGAGSRVLFLVDDMPMITGASGEARWDFAPIENVQQVEVIKGASSALYGSSALNGVINYRTSYPGLVPKTYITTIFGQYAKPEREEIAWWGNNAPIFSSTRFLHSRQAGNFDVTFGGFISSNNGYRTNNEEERYRLNASVRYRDKKVKGLSYELATNYMRRIGDIFLLWADGDSGVYKCNDSFLQEINNTYLNLYPSVIWFKNDSTKHSLKGRFFQVHNTNNTGQDNFDDMYYAEYNFHKGFPSKSLNWTNGLCANYNESVAQIYGDIRHFGSSVGLFTQADKKFNRLNVSVGARIEGYQIDDDEMKFKPVFRSGLNYSLSEQSFLRASFGMGYRYPTIAERYTATSTGDLSVFPNPELQPETGYSSEIGFKKGFRLWGWNGYADIAGFYTRYQNMIEFMFGYHNPDSVILTPFPPTAPGYFLNWVGFKAENVRNAEISGFEFVVTGEGKFLGLPASLLLGYTYTNPIDLDASADSMKSTKDNILKYRFYHSAKTDFSVEFKKLTLGANFEYQSHIINIDKAFEDTVRGPDGITPLFNPATGEYAMILPGLKEYREKHNKGFVVFDVRVGWNINEMIHVNFTAKNIFNKEYMMRPGDVQPPRTFIIQLSLKV
ncbi:MAG: hypothetical protein A2W93_07350 [Bacteroidetes bacterium GWF2_43_63]|nr:MAG: hypothetical protein A2W94_15420 [Bacteroidetes bacterium GWE2_42_42]OFY54043.1 MAG: hypothetical protein A2W93_07350 [Bacteroidetes bacterium GWF2_43_63]HCB63547.1 hypothetical protein [Bacteroidales bacterium]HCY23207.1 hypothetical protein [Bacteroidales bacterium]